MASITASNSLRSEGGEPEKGPDNPLVITDTKLVGFGVIYIGEESDNSGLNPRARANNLEKVNIYPESGVVAIGVNLSQCGMHSLVHSYTKDYLKKNSLSLSEAHIRAFRNGPDIIISLAPLSDETMEQIRSSDPSKNESARQQISDYLTRYQKAIEMATKVAESNSGKVILDLDYSEVQDVAKMLGRLYQVDTSHAKSGKAGVEKNIEYLNKSAVPYLYDRTKGSRYFFLEDLEGIAGLIANPEKSQSDVEEALSELNRYFAGRNINKVREGLIFLFDSTSNCLDLRDQTHDEIATTIADTYSSVENTNQESWPSERKRISGALTSAIEILKEKYPKFHSLNSDDSELVKVISRVLRHGAAGIELSREFSTRVSPKPLGRFVLKDEARTFEIDPGVDSTLRSVTKWLLTESTQENLRRIRSDFDITKADWIQVYEGEPLHRENERSTITKALGVVPYRSFVIEIGELGKPPLRLVVEEDQFGQEYWTRRRTEETEKILVDTSAEDVSIWIRAFKDSRFSISENILGDISQKNIISLVPNFTYSQITNAENQNEKISIRWREFRPEIRADKLVEKDLSEASILTAVHGLAKWHAFLLISGGFINSRNRDIVVDSKNGKLMALGVGGSFVSLKGFSSNELIQEIVPKLFGNSLAQFIGPFTYLSAKPSANLENLLIVYQEGFRQALKAAKSATLPPELIKGFHGIAKGSPNKLPKSLRPSLLWFEKVMKLLEDKNFKKQFPKLVAKSLREELKHIEKIIPRDDSYNPDDAEFCASALQSFIAQHMLEPKKYRTALEIIGKLPEVLPGLNSSAWGAYVALVDLKTRSEELAKKAATEEVAEYFRAKVALAEDEFQYADAITDDRQNWPANTPDLSPEELRRVYLSFKRLQGLLSETSETMNDRTVKALKKMLKLLGIGFQPAPKVAQ